MRNLDDTLDFNLRIDRSDPSGRILPIINYWIGERPDQADIAIDGQALQLRVVYPMGHS